MAGSEGRYSSSRDEGVRSRDRKNSAHHDRDRHRHRHREYKSRRDYCDESSCGKCKYSEDERVRETESEKETKRRWSDHHMKRERTSPKQLKQHEQSNLSDLVPGSISKSHGCFKEHEMVTETESEREKKQRRRSDQNTNSKRELTSPKQELKKQQSNRSDLLPFSISPKVTAIEKREDKVQRTGWDQLPTIDLTAEKPTVPEEVATKYVVLTDMFDPEIEEPSELYLDIRDEIQEECCKIGAVVDDIHLDRKTGGLCIRFDNNRSAAVAKKKFHEWERRGESIKATYLEEERYRKRYAW